MAEKQIGAVFVQRKVVPAHWEFECPTCGTWMSDWYRGKGGEMACYVCTNSFCVPSAEELLAEDKAQHNVT